MEFFWGSASLFVFEASSSYLSAKLIMDWLECSIFEFYDYLSMEAYPILNSVFLRWFGFSSNERDQLFEFTSSEDKFF